MADVVMHGHRLQPGALPLRFETANRRWADPIRIRGGADDIVRICFDGATGLIRAYAGGCWSELEARHYISALTIFIEGSRSELGKARVLLDRREIGSQSPAVAALLAQANGAIFWPDDKIALVVASSVAKVSLRTRMPHPGTKAFLSIEAAETWLRAFGNWR